VLFSRVFHEQIEDQLFGALMSALSSFSDKLLEGGLQNFELNKIRFTIIKKNDLIFIVNSSKKHKESKVMQQLENIANKFFSVYPDTFLKKWDNDINAFSNFKNEIENILEDPIKKFWQDFLN